MSGTSITTAGAGKGAVSKQTPLEAATAKAKDAIAAQQKAAKDASLRKSITSLQEQITKKGGYNDQKKQQQAYLDYDNNMILHVKWGTDINYNQRIYHNQYKSGSSNVQNGPGSSLTVEDQRMILNDISAIQLLIDAAQKNIDDNNAIIAKDNAIITGKPIVTPGKTGPAGVSKTTVINSQAQTSVSGNPPAFPDKDYKWNLPPHSWSLPTDPASINPTTVSGITDNSRHASRRGRIWYYNGYVGTTNQLDPATGTYKADDKGNPLPGNQVTNKYGFQFIWNPETFSQSTQVNMNVTPSNTDPSANLTGFVAANSTMEFTIRLDRTNDFAAAKGKLSMSKLQQTPADIALAAAYAQLEALDTSNSFISKYSPDAIKLTQLSEYYKVGKFVRGTTSVVDDLDQKIADLLTYGTEADLEYLYRTVNGDDWTGIGGRKTANMGYLMPSLIRVDLGEQRFVGVVASISVNHLAFTIDMVPIRSDVNITIDLRANTTYSTNTSKKKSG